MGHDLLINKNKSLSELFSSSSHIELRYLLPLLVNLGLDKKLESIITNSLSGYTSSIPAEELSKAILGVCEGGSFGYTYIILNALQRLGVEASKEECIFDLETKLLVKFFGEKLEEHPVFKREKLEKTSIFGEPIVGFKSFEYKLPSIETMNPLSTIQWLIENKNIEEIYKNTYSTVFTGVYRINLLNIFSKKPEPTLREGTYPLLLRIALMRQIQIAFDFQRYSYELRSSI
ncbi:hypothetical protein [Pseudoalteromonas rhizosphaerae]|uniref:hypothetical protein n=1 Tax=Pseudoalteromonas rhizosphaerae TaxID=2518973 RepID=UPI0012316BC7|nr:hypothetical protein [Pseudoalteromonas rhizosphaerae]